jgi:hypothetical protein
MAEMKLPRAEPKARDTAPASNIAVSKTNRSRRPCVVVFIARERSSFRDRNESINDLLEAELIIGTANFNAVPGYKFSITAFSSNWPKIGPSAAHHTLALMHKDERLDHRRGKKQIDCEPICC